jgi:hypothetical protein
MHNHLTTIAQAPPYRFTDESAIFASMLRPRKYSLGSVVDTIWIAATVAAIWGTIVWLLGVALTGWASKGFGS